MKNRLLASLVIAVAFGATAYARIRAPHSRPAKAKPEPRPKWKLRIGRLRPARGRGGTAEAWVAE